MRDNVIRQSSYALGYGWVMRAILFFGGMLTIWVAGTVAANAGAEPSARPTSRLVREIPLQSFFHTAHAWQLEVYQAPGPAIRADSDVSALPVRVCFVQPPVPDQAATVCASLRISGQPYQTLDSAQLRMLPGHDGKADRSSVVIRATAVTGFAGEDQLHGLFVWTYGAGAFLMTFHSAVNLSGEQEFMESGALRGSFVRVRQVSEGDEQTMLSPRHYQMTVYEPVRSGYVEVLTILSNDRYPSGLLGEGIPDPISMLAPEIVRALKAVYPGGVHRSAVQR